MRPMNVRRRNETRGVPPKQLDNGIGDTFVSLGATTGVQQVFKKYSQMKLQMKHEALEKINRQANEMAPVATDARMAAPMCTVTVQWPHSAQFVHGRG